MSKFIDSDGGEAFLASAASRETSPEIMEAIAFFATNLDEAETLWSGDGFGVICHLTDLWERVTGNGRRDPEEFCWGASGSHWWDDLKK